MDLTSAKTVTRSELNEGKLLVAADDLRGLESHPGFKFLMERLARVEAVAVEAMKRGPNLDKEQYTRQMGFLSGAGIVRDIIGTVHEEVRRIREREAAEAEARNEDRAAATKTGLLVP